MILSIPGHTNKRTAQSYLLVIFTNKRPKNRQGTPRDINENSSQYFLGQKLSDFLSFLRTKVQLRPLITFPSPDQNFAEVQIFVFSPHNTWQVAIDALMKIADFSIKIISSSYFFVLKNWYYPLLDIQAKELLKFIF